MQSSSLSSSLSSVLLVTALGAVAASGLGCSVSVGGPGASADMIDTVSSGSVDGQSLKIAGAVARMTTISTNDVNGVRTETRGLRILLSDRAITCGALPATAAFLDIGVPGDGAPATYTVIDARQATPIAGQAEADFDVATSSNRNALAQTAASGQVVITSEKLVIVGVEPSTVDGTFDLTFPGGTLRGPFHATLCNDGTAPHS
jgi:hypothetical protein